MKIGAVIQARVSSTRLPAKVLRELPFGSGITVLEQVIRRLGKARKVDSIIVATSRRREDDAIARIALRSGAKCYRGSLNDVLSRYYHAARENELDAVVRITSDCPCIDPALVDRVIGRHRASLADYTSNTLKRSFPRGFDVEVMKFAALEDAHENAKKGYEREHVTPYIYGHPECFKIEQLKAPPGLSAPDIRITLDTEEDYTLLCAVFDYFYKTDKYFNAYKIINLFEKKPWLRLVNRNVAQKKT